MNIGGNEAMIASGVVIVGEMRGDFFCSNDSAGQTHPIRMSAPVPCRSVFFEELFYGGIARRAKGAPASARGVFGEGKSGSP